MPLSRLIVLIINAYLLICLNGTRLVQATNKHLKKDLFVQDLSVWPRSGKPV